MSNGKFLERPLPSSEEAERTILGGIMLNNNLAHEVFSYLTPEDFYGPLHKRVAKAMYALHKTARPIEPILIGEEMKRDSPIESIGGIATINNLTYGLMHFRTLMEYIELVRTKSLARQTIFLLQRASTSLLEEDEDVEQIIAATAKTLIQYGGGGDSKTETLKSVADSVRTIFEQWEAGNQEMSGIPTGIPELDAKLRLNGIAYGELTLIAARPSMGKTALLLQMATHAIGLGVPTLFISLEMQKERIVMRMLPARTGIPNKAINPTTLKNMPEEREQLYAALGTMTEPMYFDRSFQLHKLIANAEYHVQTQGVKLVVFDYLTLIKNGVAVRDSFDKVGNIGEITKELKELAVRTNTAVLGAAQLSRSSEKEQRRPNMTDLRDSGEIEQAVDTLIFPYDPDAKFHSQNPDVIANSVWLDLYCAKQREGERGWMIPVEYDKNIQTFKSAEMLGHGRPAVPMSAQPVPAQIPASYVDTDDDDDDYDRSQLPDF